jgi:putative endonuclease
MIETSDVSEFKYFVYVLFSLKDKGLYIGFTTNLKNRFSRHTRGEVLSTANRRPLKMVYFEGYTNIKDAKAREVFLKSGFGRKNLKQALKNTLETLINN